MNIRFAQNLITFTKYNFTKSKNNFVNRAIDTTRNDVFNFIDLVSGNQKRQLQAELVKYNKQLAMIQQNLNSSIPNSPSYIDILR